MTKQAQYNVGLVERPAPVARIAAMHGGRGTTDAAGQALQDGKFEQATKELEKLEDAADRQEGGQDPRGEAQAGRQGRWATSASAR